MIPLVHPPHRPAWKKIVSRGGLCAMFFWLGVMLTPLLADGTNAAPAAPPPSDFGHYIVDHQDDLSPFFDKHTTELVAGLVPVLIALLGRIVVLMLIACWFVDVFLIRCYSAYFAPFYARLKRSMLYATIQAVINLVAAVLLLLLAFWMITAPDYVWVFGVLILLVFLLVLAAQIWWVSYLYRMGIIPSIVFNLSLVAVHLVIVLLVSTPVVGHAPQLWTDYMDQTVVPKMKNDINAAKHDLADISHKRDDIKGQVAEAQNRLTQATAQRQELQKQIEDDKNSEVYLFSQIAKTRAKGDLTAAHDRLADFIAKFPSGSLIETAKTELTAVNGDIAAQDAQKKQDEADAVAAAARARADLLNDAKQGKATLSEMRTALLGKTSAQVTELFGPPVETASDRWGYGQQMIVNPLTGEKFGLTIYFEQGVVQSVDYYYGKSK